MIDFNNSRLNRRIGVVVHHLSSSLMMFFVMARRTGDWTLLTGVSTFVFACLSLYTGYFVFNKTGIFKQMHSKWDLFHPTISKLDERQTWVVHEAVRYSYTTYSVLSIIIIYLFKVIPELMNYWSFIAFYMFMLAQHLPSTIVAWREKRV